MPWKNSSAKSATALTAESAPDELRHLRNLYIRGKRRLWLTALSALCTAMFCSPGEAGASPALSRNRERKTASRITWESRF